MAYPCKTVLPVHSGLGIFMTIKSGLAAAALIATVAAASAADMGSPVYKAPPMAVAAYNWSGLYAGVHIGYGSGDLNGDWGTGQNTHSIHGFFGGGQLGYNWQAAGSPWVFGVEADISVSGIGADETIFGLPVETRMNGFGTARVRYGYAANNALWYVTGGFAWAHNKFDVTPPGFATFKSSNNHVGWTVGGGLEWALADAWTAKVEYLYIDMTDETYFADIPPLSIKLDPDIHTVRVGLNYRFGAGKAPVVAKY